MKCMKLNDEKKFFINKNLFENNTIKPLKSFTFNLPSNSSNKENENVVPKGNATLVEANPLDSTAALKQNKEAKKEVESPMVKSLFDFKENEKYKPKTDEESKGEVKPPKFNFDTKNLFGEPGSKERGMVLKPQFAVSNPFANMAGTSPIFTSGKSLFETSNLNPFGFKMPTQQPVEKKEDDEDKLEPDVKEKVEANSQFEKLFQKQIEKLKILKGITDKNPGKKGLGYLSIEKRKDGSDSTHFIVYRNCLGANQF